MYVCSNKFAFFAPHCVIVEYFPAHTKRVLFQAYFLCSFFMQRQLFFFIVPVILDRQFADRQKFIFNIMTSQKKTIIEEYLVSF